MPADYIPLMLSYSHYRWVILRTLGVQPAHHLMKRLFQLAPYLQAKVIFLFMRTLGVQLAHHLTKRLFQLAPYLQAKV